MYHELLMALLGYTGDVFQYDGLFIKVSKNLQVPLFHPSELVIIDQILEIASLYKRLEDFLESQFQFDKICPTETESESVNVTKTGVPIKKMVGRYVSSLCNGIQDILESYQMEVSKLEMEILEDPYMTVTSIRAKIEPYRAVFEALDVMILKIQTHSKSSSLVVEVVKGEYDLNIHLQDYLKSLVPHVNRILYNQIINWIVFGSLHDPQGEFFIKQQQARPLQSSSKHSLEVSNASSTTSCNSSVTSPSPSVRFSPRSMNSKAKRNQEKFYVDYAIVPSHFPVALTDRILYIGSSVGILRNSEKTKASIMLKQKQFQDKLKQLPTNTFRIEELSEVIAEISVEVGKDLHHLVVAETDLPKHLGIVKDFFLTGRGELFHDFLLNLKSITMLKGSLLADVQRAFTLAATRVQVQDEILQRIQIQLPPDISNPNVQLVMGSISLGMEDEWPLHILFTKESLLKYNELFRFLLQVRLLHMELNMIWLDTRRVFRFPVPQGPAELRNVMSYFIDHLQHYLQEDVLENQFAILSNAVEKSENFDQILVAHAHFQSNILAQSFRTSKQLRHFLDGILKICSNFVNFITNQLQLSEANDQPINEGTSEETIEFAKDFKRHMDLLLNLLKNMALNPQSGQFLGQFLLRLDFNSYWSSLISGFSPKVIKV